MLKNRTILHRFTPRFSRWASQRSSRALIAATSASAVVVCALLAVFLFDTIAASASPEAKFTDASRSGLAIVPASGASTPYVPPVPGPTGYLETANCGSGGVTGWAVDLNNKTSAAKVGIYIDGKLIGSIAPANSSSGTNKYNRYSDQAGYSGITYTLLANAPLPTANTKIRTTGNHGFVWTIPDVFQDNATHTISAIAWGGSGGLDTANLRISTGVATETVARNNTGGPSGGSVLGGVGGGGYDAGYGGGYIGGFGGGYGRRAVFICNPNPAPTNLTATCDAATHVASFSWNGVTGATTYQFKALDDQTNVPSEYTVNGTSFSLNGLNSPSYSWSVSACTGSTCSSAVSGSTLSCGLSCAQGNTAACNDKCPDGSAAPDGDPNQCTCRQGNTAVCNICGDGSLAPNNDPGQCARDCRTTQGDYCNTTDGNIYHRFSSCNQTLKTQCPYGCSTISETCTVPVPQITQQLNARPTLVRKGDTSVVSWAVEHVQSCTVTSTNLQTFSCSGDSCADLANNTHETTSLLGQTVYTLSCIPLPGAVDFDGSPYAWSDEHATISIAPTQTEN